MLNFNLVSETQPKTNIRTYLFVLKSSFERISRNKNGSPKIRFETISYSHLASKFNFGKHPYQNLGRPKHPWALRNSLPKRRFKTVKTSRHVLTHRFKANDGEKDARSSSLQFPNLPWTRNTLFFSSVWNILSSAKYTKCQPLTSAYNFKVERTIPEHNRKNKRTHFAQQALKALRKSI